MEVFTGLGYSSVMKSQPVLGRDSAFLKCVSVRVCLQSVLQRLFRPSTVITSIYGREVVSRAAENQFVSDTAATSFVLKLCTGNQLQLLLPEDIKLLS